MNRKNQYQRKMEYIVDKLSVLPEDVKENSFYEDALYYRLQTAIDGVMDIVAMLCKDFGITVNDDYSNIEELSKNKLFEPEFHVFLKKLNGLRNILVHQYNKVELNIILEQKEHIVANLLNFVKDVEKILDEQLQID